LETWQKYTGKSVSSASSKILATVSVSVIGGRDFAWFIGAKSLFSIYFLMLYWMISLFSA